MTVDVASLVSDNLDIWTTAVERKSGAGRGSGKRVSLYGIDRLRALILDLAVRGKLVPQDANDEPAQKVLGRICLSNPRDLPSPRFEIPTSWCWVKFGQIAKFKPGRTPSRKDSRYWGGKHPWVSIADMEDGATLTNTAETVSDLASEAVFRGSLSPAGSILMSFKLTIGKISRLAMPAYHNEAIITVTPSIQQLDPYLFRFLPICARTGASRNAIKGATLNSASISEIAIPLPPLAEQQRIVAKVDELIALCDALDAESEAAMSAHQALVEALLATLTASTDAADLTTNWTRLEAHFDTLFTTESSVDALKQAVLELAVQGQLSAQETRDEPASELLKRIKVEKAQLIKEGKIKRDKPLPPIKDAEKSFSLPNGWVWSQPDEFSIKITDGEHFRPVTTLSGVYFLSAKDIRETGVSLAEPLFVSQEIADKARSRCDPEFGDLLIVSRGATCGRICKVDIEEVFCLLGSVILLKPSSLVNNHYLEIALKSPRIFEALISASGATAQGAIYLRDLKKIGIPLPPIAEQQRIVTKVDELIALCDALKAGISDVANTQKHLADVVLEQAAA